MADFVPMRTGQFVVRRYQPSWMRPYLLVGGIVLSLLLLYGAYEWGRASAGFSKLDEFKRRGEITTQLKQLQRDNEKLRGDLASVETARDVDHKAYADVERNLAELQAQVLKQREELTFYRGIVSPEDGIGGLRIQRVRVVSGAADRRFSLRLVLVQSMRHDAVVSGVASVKIEGVQDGRAIELPLSKLSDTQRDDELAFQFRYFQEVQEELVLPPGFEPRAITVEVRSPRMEAVRESFPWRVSAEG